MKIRAAVLSQMGTPAPYAKTRPLAIEELDLAPPGYGEVLVKIAAAGLCHSDLSVINGDRPRPLPMVLGHEAAGVVEKLGDGVTDLAPGDHVILVFVPSCGHCPPCSEGRPALCEPGFAANSAGTLLGGARRLSRNGVPINHLLGCAAFAEYATVSRRSLVKIDKALPMAEAALFGCAVMTGVGAVVNTAQVRAGASTAVIGLGGVGLASVLGATHTFNASAPDTVEKIREATSGGVEYAFELAGSARALESAYKITRRGGTTVTAGLPPPSATMPLSPLNLVAEERTLKGSYIGTCVPSRDIPRYVALYQQGKLAVDRLMTGTLKLDQINEGFDLLHEGKAVRQVILFD